MTYELVKVGHLLAVISWMAGLLYLPRLMVYHARAEAGSELSETLKVMERRLLKAITTPAMVAAWIFGIWLAGMQGLWSQWPAWWIAKVVCIAVLTGAHMWLARQVKLFAADNNELTSRAYRVMNEVPTVLMIAIVLFVVVKPFG